MYDNKNRKVILADILSAHVEMFCFHFYPKKQTINIEEEECQEKHEKSLRHESIMW